MKQKFYNLSNDYLFKTVFRNFRLLKQMVIDIYNFDLSGYSFDNPKIQSDNKNLSNGEYDLLLTNGIDYVILEMQNSKYGNFINRSEIYRSMLVSKDWQKGDVNYNHVKFVKLFWLLNYRHYKKEFLKYQMREEETYERFGDKNEVWIFNIKNVHQKELLNKYKILFQATKPKKIEALVDDKEVGNIAKEILRYNADLETYEKMVRSEFMQWTHEDDLKLMKDVSYREGIEIGERRGEKRGEKKGKQMGILKTALSMFQEGIDISLIKKITGLTETEILNLKNHSL